MFSPAASQGWQLETCPSGPDRRGLDVACYMCLLLRAASVVLTPLDLNEADLEGPVAGCVPLMFPFDQIPDRCTPSLSGR
ncbi:MAG: hypothetical protein PHQ40_18235 [Anaerolineaceae bacterium]|nr:hypothetical protein [Anaerolineaceae bacterium]